MELVPIPAVLSAPYAGVQLSEEAARAPGRGLQSAGRSVMEVGGQLEEYSQRVQQAKNTVDLIKAQQEMKAARSRFNEWALTNPDETQWEKRSREEVAKAKQNIAGLKLSRDAQDRLAGEMTAFEQDFPTEVRFAAKDKEVKRMRAFTYQSALDDAKAGDLNSAFMKVENGIKDGIIDETEGRMKQKEFSQEATKAFLLKTINDDPLTTQEMLDAKTDKGQWANFRNQLSEADRLTLSRSAANAIASMREQTAQGFSEKIYAGETLGLSEQIDEAVATKRLLPLQANYLKKQMTGGWEPGEIQAVSGSLLEAVQGLDPSDSNAFDMAALRIVGEASALPADVKQFIESAINRKRADGATNAELAPSINPHAYLKKKLDDGELGQYDPKLKPQYVAEKETVGHFWWKKEQIARSPSGKAIPKLDEEGEPIIDEAKMQELRKANDDALARYSAAEVELQNFIKQYPKSTIEERMAFVRKSTESIRLKMLLGGPKINPSTVP